MIYVNRISSVGKVQYTTMQQYLAHSARLVANCGKMISTASILLRYAMFSHFIYPQEANKKIEKKKIC